MSDKNALSFLDSKVPETYIILYAKTGRRVKLEYKVDSNTFEYCLSQLDGEKSIVRPTHSTDISFIDYKENVMQ